MRIPSFYPRNVVDRAARHRPCAEEGTRSFPQSGRSGRRRKKENAIISLLKILGARVTSGRFRAWRDDRQHPGCAGIAANPACAERPIRDISGEPSRECIEIRTSSSRQPREEARSQRSLPQRWITGTSMNRFLFRFAFLPRRRAVRFKRLLIPKSPKLSRTVEFA